MLEGLSVVLVSMSAWAVPDDSVLKVSDHKGTSTNVVKDYIITATQLAHMCFEDGGKFRCMESGIAVKSEKSVQAESGSAELDLKVDRCIASEVHFKYQATEDVELVWSSAKFSVDGKILDAGPKKNRIREPLKMKAGERYEDLVISAQASCWPLKAQTISFSMDVKAGDETRSLEAQWDFEVKELTKEETVSYVPRPKVPTIAPNTEGLNGRAELPKKSIKPAAISASVSGGVCLGLSGGLALATGLARDEILPASLCLGGCGLFTAMSAGITGWFLTDVSPEENARYRTDVKRVDYKKRFELSQAEVKLWDETIGPRYLNAQEVTSRIVKPKKVVAMRRLNFGYEAPPSPFSKREKRLGEGCSEDEQRY